MAQSKHQSRSKNARTFTWPKAARRLLKAASASTILLIGVIDPFHFLLAQASVPGLGQGRERMIQPVLPPVDTMVGTMSDDIKVRIDTVKVNSAAVSGMNLRMTGQITSSGPGYRALKISWRRVESDRELHEWRVIDRDRGVTVVQVKARQFSLNGSSLRLNLRPVHGKITFAPSARDSSMDVIATLDIENYLFGVLPSEMPKDWPLEALKAQAIAARTFAHYRKQAREASGATYHVESSVMDQVYLMPVLNEGEDASRANVERAVRETRGMILEDRKRPGRALAAYFHSDCAGHTEDARVVWGNRGAGTASCPFSANPKWRVRLSAEELNDKLRIRLKTARDSVVTALEPFGQTRSGRIRDLRVTLNSGKQHLIPAHVLRMLVGHDRIKSTNFQIESHKDGYFVFSGRGAGHGVGMCQHGARALAQNGRSFRDILTLYYPLANLAGEIKPSPSAPDEWIARSRLQGRDLVR